MYSLASESVAWPKEPEDNCCVIFENPDYKGKQIDFCLEGEERNTAYSVSMWRDRTYNLGSIKCGKHVDATICPNEFEYGAVPEQRGLGYRCSSNSETVPERGTKISAQQKVRWLDITNRESSILLSLHPWTTKNA